MLKTAMFRSEEMLDIAMPMLNASVDTTSTSMWWTLVHLSVNLDMQENLYREVKQNMEAAGGALLTPDLLT
jgi:cytochrome P450